MSSLKINHLLIAIYLVTWKTFYTVEVYPKPDDMIPECQMKTDYHQEEFFSWFSAWSRADALKQGKGNYDVKMWELEEDPKKREIK